MTSPRRGPWGLTSPAGWRSPRLVRTPGIPAGSEPALGPRRSAPGRLGRPAAGARRGARRRQHDAVGLAPLREGTQRAGVPPVRSRPARVPARGPPLAHRRGRGPFKREGEGRAGFRSADPRRPRDGGARSRARPRRAIGSPRGGGGAGAPTPRPARPRPPARGAPLALGRRSPAPRAPARPPARRAPPPRMLCGRRGSCRPAPSADAATPRRAALLKGTGARSDAARAPGTPPSPSERTAGRGAVRRGTEARSDEGPAAPRREQRPPPR